MLKQIRCDRFAPEFQTVTFYPGLNAVLGSSSGSNALGKSTFLWIIDYAFGGDAYCAPESDIKNNIKDHILYFTFIFDGTEHYFYRNTATPKTVCRCDKDGHLIEEMPLEKYRQFLSESYQAGVRIDEILTHFFRIYGRDNTYETTPYLEKPRQMPDKALEFLLRLFRQTTLLAEIHTLEDEVGVKSAQFKGGKLPLKSFEKIEENERTIKSLRDRYDSLMSQTGGSGLSYLGFDDGTYERLAELQKQLRKLTRRRNQISSRIEALKNGNGEFLNESIQTDFSELSEFFPGADLKSLSDISIFHIRIREILREEIDAELESLEPVLKQCDNEIARLKAKIETTGLANEVMQNVLTQCVRITARIEVLEDENRTLLREREAQEERLLAARRLEQKLVDRQLAIEEAVSKINTKLTELNRFVTNGLETGPILTITPEPEITFKTPGDTSEGTAYKSMILYDLSLLALTDIPVLIHDSNILHSISTEHLQNILKLYMAGEKQVFIAYDGAENEELYKSAILRLSDDHELFGYSWSKTKRSEQGDDHGSDT